ncbi:uncharacterized protein LY79DRAFT_215926 [Colletotrichum navitas]|uniref:Uncharacterized protein n=1 Tax=Colletotrichum navitas TaxID=681940 RepID=A0AAD8PZW0_9PEZI|nr:uncharacterized protein LY79DRAFT_215926 [Colletotrichum navitas]KAK1590634.1 hypothetical protein LY79DRAFT_215926 [Colletotrichum navitas]
MHVSTMDGIVIPSYSHWITSIERLRLPAASHSHAHTHTHTPGRFRPACQLANTPLRATTDDWISMLGIDTASPNPPSPTALWSFSYRNVYVEQRGFDVRGHRLALGLDVVRLVIQFQAHCLTTGGRCRTGGRKPVCGSPNATPSLSAKAAAWSPTCPSYTEGPPQRGSGDFRRDGRGFFWAGI